MPRIRLTTFLYVVPILIASQGMARAQESSDRWEPDISAFESKDKEQFPEPGGVVFVGSSSIKRWETLDDDFPQTNVINRGFGGSQMIDSVAYAERIVIPYRPAKVVVYAGDNDIAKGKSPQTVLQDFQTFTKTVLQELPETHIGYIAIKPSLKRWSLWPTMSRANELIRSYASETAQVHFLDISKPMLGQDGTPKPSLFVDDGLHLSPQGYDVWTSVVRPWVERH